MQPPQKWLDIYPGPRYDLLVGSLRALSHRPPRPCLICPVACSLRFGSASIPWVFRVAGLLFPPEMNEMGVRRKPGTSWKSERPKRSAQETVQALNPAPMFRLVLQETAVPSSHNLDSGFSSRSYRSRKFLWGACFFAARQPSVQRGYKRKATFLIQ